MPDRVSIHLRTDAESYDLTAYADGARWDRSLSGARSLTIPVPLILGRALALYDARGTPPDVIVRRGPRTLWRGRLESASLGAERDGAAVTLRAVGYTAALSDIRHTALWSDTQYDQWQWLTGEDSAGIASDRYDHDTDGRLHFTLKKNSIINAVDHYAAWGYVIPSRSTRGINRITFDYVFAFPPNWRLYVQSRPSGFGSPGINVTSILPSVGAVDVSFAPTAAVMLILVNETGANYTNTSETGDLRILIETMRLRTTTGAVTAGAIAQHLVTEISAANPSQLSTSTRLIVDPGLDLSDVRYEDATAFDVLTELAAKGDGLGTLYEVGVTDDRELYVRPRTTGRTWHVTASSLEVERSRESVENRVYARYEDADGRPQRTASLSNAASIAAYGLIRDGMVEAQTTVPATAEGIRNVYAADVADPRPAARIAVERIQSDAGGIVTGDAVQPGDAVIVALPVSRGTGLDRIRQFRVSETSYDAGRDQATLAPEQPLPTLDVLLAQASREVTL